VNRNAPDHRVCGIYVGLPVWMSFFFLGKACVLKNNWCPIGSFWWKDVLKLFEKFKPSPTVYLTMEHSLVWAG
jgi:hypothetical protein